MSAQRLARLRVLIPQEAYVFAGTVWDNLTYLRPSATPGQVSAATAAVGADSLVVALGGWAARVVPAELSAGQRQLLSLARAYLSPAPIAVLDEATCHLDPAAERRAEEAFARRGGTLIVIAHRISSARRARRILVFDGVGVSVGDHATLSSSSPLYRELLGYWDGHESSVPAGGPVPARRPAPVRRPAPTAAPATTAAARRPSVASPSVATPSVATPARAASAPAIDAATIEAATIEAATIEAATIDAATIDAVTIEVATIPGTATPAATPAATIPSTATPAAIPAETSSAAATLAGSGQPPRDPAAPAPSGQIQPAS
jgi:energy-coupling factor transporter ATP-binding protein EcfA2